jgi:hypothetical protein
MAGGEKKRKKRKKQRNTEDLDGRGDINTEWKEDYAASA